MKENTKNMDVKRCCHCNELVDITECKADQYWTNNGDRVVYHICVECGESVEEIFFDDDCNNDFDGFDSYDGYNDRYTSSTRGDYSPSNPWDAPGMSIKDFI